jgi:fumarate hydratase class I
MIVARDLAHAKIRERLEKRRADAGLFQEPSGLLRRPGQDAGGLRLRLLRPDHGRAHGFLCRPVPGRRRLDGDARQGQPLGGRCARPARNIGGFYLGSIGGPAARLAQDCIKKVEVLEYPELGMEAIWRIEVENFPAFIVIDDKGNDFFKELNLG